MAEGEGEGEEEAVGGLEEAGKSDNGVAANSLVKPERRERRRGGREGGREGEDS